LLKIVHFVPFKFFATQIHCCFCEGQPRLGMIKLD